MVSGQIGDMQQPKRPKPTLVPSAIIPSSCKQIVHSESDGDSQMEAEEAAYHKELAKNRMHWVSRDELNLNVKVLCLVL